LAWEDELADELALESFAAAFACFVGFAVVLLVLLVSGLAADDCPSAARGEAQAHTRARAQPAPSHIRIFARCRFGSKGNPQTSERTRSTALPDDPRKLVGTKCCAKSKAQQKLAL
jgi:hypothetical protein